jgi:hypothetical protein
MKHVFGGASILVEVQPLSDEISIDPGVADISKFLFLMQKAYQEGRSEPFSRGLRAFSEEVDNYLDDAHIEREASNKEIEEILASLALKFSGQLYVEEFLMAAGDFIDASIDRIENRLILMLDRNDIRKDIEGRIVSPRKK